MNPHASHSDTSVAPKRQEDRQSREKTLEQPHRVSLTPENDPAPKPAKS